jgi:hypothetical protein
LDAFNIKHAVQAFISASQLAFWRLLAMANHYLIKIDKIHLKKKKKNLKLTYKDTNHNSLLHVTNTINKHAKANEKLNA